MIKSFRHKGLEKFFLTGSKAGIIASHEDRLNRQLTRLNRAQIPEDVRVPGWFLHPLKGKLDGFWSIWVNGNWRLTFRFTHGGVEIVDYQDYH
ncbi:MAG: type II toxin-antitoxin system RelE/ParE family toxin [Bryocella sp.]